MILKSMMSLFAAVTATALLAGCGTEGASGSPDVEMSVSEGGLILPVAQQTCVDRDENTGSRSATANSLNLGAMTFKWIPANRALFIGTFSVTIRSPRIVGGSQQFFVAGDELEVMLGAVGQTIGPEGEGGTLGNKTIISNQAANRAGYAACTFVLGGIKFVDPTIRTAFTANVTIELIGTKSGSDANPLDQTDAELVRETFTTTANFPGL